MSTATPAPTPTLEVSETPRIPFGRSVVVELRKMVDTRSGFWLMLISGLLLVAITAIVMLVVTTSDIAITANGWVQVMIVPLSLLLPIFAITAVTSEWGQRTGLVSFTLEPQRGKVVAAKLAAVVALVVVATVLAVALGALANLLYGAIDGGGAVWNIDVSEFFAGMGQQMVTFLMAFGLGMLILNTPAAIAVYYVFSLLLPFMVYSAVYVLVSWGPDVLPFIDLGFAFTPFVGGASTGPGVPTPTVDGMAYLQLAVAITIWVVLPMVLGGRRVARAEIK